MSRVVPHLFLGRSTKTIFWGNRRPSPDPGPEGAGVFVPGGRRGEPDARTWLGGMESDLFRHPQPRRAGAGVGRHLRLRWADGTAGDDAEGCPVAAGADWLLGWADTVF